MGADRRLGKGRLLLALVIVLLVSADTATIIARRQHGRPSAPPARAVSTSAAAPKPTRESRVLFREDFSSSAVFHPNEEDGHTTALTEGEFRLRTRAGFDVYEWLPDRAIGHAALQQAEELSVTVEARSTTGDPRSWFGVFCRSHGLDNDVYVAVVRPGGSWAIIRATLGSTHEMGYVQRALADGRVPARAGIQPLDVVVRIRFDCLGTGPTILRLYQALRVEVGSVT